jgi:hypothetical protein
LYAELIGSDTTTSYQAAGYFDNSVLNSSTGILYGIYSSSSGATGATRIGLQTDGAGGTASSRGVYGTATSATGYLVGGDFRAFGAGTKIGVAGILSSVTEIASPVATAALFDNSSVAAPIAIFRDNGTPVFSIEDGGNPKLSDSTGGQFYTIAKSNLAADRQLNLPLLTGTDTFATLGLAQTFDLLQTFTGGVTLPVQADACFQDSAGGDQYCLQAEATAPAGTTTLTLNIDPATCTGDGNGGKLTVDGSNNIICSADAGGAGGGLTHPQVMARASYGGF